MASRTNEARSGNDSERMRPCDILGDEEKQEVVGYLNEKLGIETCGEKLFLHQERAIGNGDSAHDVFFVETSMAGKRWYSSFACKRFRRPDKAERELSAIQEASSRGFNTLTPAGKGIYDVRGVGSVLVTRTLPRITTMNHTGWADSFPGHDDYEKKVAEPLERIASFVGEMHNSGIYHGDLQLKNIAVNARGQFLLFDLEDAEFFDDESDFTVVEKYIDDYRKLVNSLVDRGFLWDASDELFAEEIDTRVAEPYLEANKNVSAAVIDGFYNVVQDALVRRAAVRQKFSEKWRDTYAGTAA